MENSFRKANERMLEQHGFELPLSAIASESRIHAEKIACGQRAESREANLLPGRGANNIIAEADGSFVRIVSTNAGSQDARKTRKVDYQEVRLCAATAQGSREVFYGATFDPVDTVAPLWAQAAKRAGMALHSRVHVLADGAVWIDSQRVAAFGERGQMLIDLYHVLEYLGQAAESCSDNQLRWLKTQKKRLKTGRSDKVIAELEKHLEDPAEPELSAPVRRAWRYLDNRRDYLAYDKAIEKNLPLGSGLIESGNKHVLQARLKIPGASWNVRTAENFAKTRAMRANQQWNQYWQDTGKAA